jgi:multiple sugar transport system ATP-binding protein
MASVTLTNVCKTYDGGVRAVQDVNLEVEDREFVVFVGPSGCGKSTTLRMIAGLEGLTSGDICIDGQSVSHVPPKDRDIAMVFQNYALYPHMTARENMAFGLKLRKMPKEEIERRVREAADILGIAPLLDRRPGAMSGGERQRVAVGRAIVRKPKVFLFDEPLSNLDAKLRVQMRVEIKRLHARLEATMIYVTHDQVEAMTLGDRIAVMQGGRIQQVDAPMDLYHRPANRFVAGFIGSPAMNFVEGRLVRDRGLAFHDGEVQIPLPESYGRAVADLLDRPLVLGIRPEAFSEVPPEQVRNGGPAIPATVEVVELMGSEVLIYATTGKTQLVAKVPAERLPAIGEKVWLAFDMGRAHLFDGASEKALSISDS